MLCLRSARQSCALLALSIAPGFATVVTYGDITAWQNATAAGFTTIPFDNLASINSSTQFSTGLTIAGTTFNGGGLLWADNTPPGTSYNFGSGSVLEGPACCSSGGILITLPSSTSIGFDFMTYGVSGINFIATVNNNLQYTSVPTLPWSYPNPTRAFFGFTTTADTPITNIFLNLPNNASGVSPLIDNFRYGTAGTDPGDPGPPPADTPEACTLLLIGSGLAGMSVFHRRLRRVAAAAV